MRKLLIYFLSFISLNVLGQNIVLNPSFEQTLNGCSGVIPIEGFTDLINWDNANSNTPGDSCSSPDLFSTCNEFTVPPNPPFTGVPANALGWQYPKTGEKYAGLIAYSAPFGFADNYREYIQGTTSVPLVGGQTYCVSINVSLANDSPWACNNMGVYFSNNQYLRDACAQGSLISETPQLNYACAVITDTTANWFRIQWDYVATGGEQYFVIGNFFNDNNTTVASTGASNFQNMYAYYYIDDVSITENSCCFAEIITPGVLCPTDPPLNLSLGFGNNGNSCTPSIEGGTWSGNGITNSSDGTFSPAVAGPGTHTISFTLSCGYVATTEVVVGNCEPLEACLNTDGTITVSNGINPYTWEEYIPPSSSPINNEATCQACGYMWVGLPFNQCLDGVTPVTTCNSPGGYVFMASGNNITPGSNFPIRITDPSGAEIIINDISELVDCVVVPCPTITVSISNQTDVLCFGGNTGTATVSASGGNGPYTYTWTPGSLSGATQNSLSAQTYTVNVVDNDGCPGTVQVTINQPTQLTATTSAVEASCGVSDGSATVNPSGGTGAYTYNWNPDVGNTATVNNIPAGSYQVTVTDANNCQIQESILVNNQNAPSASITSTTDESCVGAADGAATVEASGGSGNYTYSWSPSGGTSATASNLTAGNYTVTVTDDAGCETSIVVTINSTSVILIDAIITDEDCGVMNGELIASASGGNGNYSYTWSNGETTSTISNLQTGEYSVTVTDDLGCSNSETFTVGVIGSLDVTVNPTTTTIEAGESVQLEASGGFTYTWTPETGLSCTDCPNPIASPINTTSYTVTAVDENGCAGEATVLVFVEALCGEFFVPTIFSPNADGTNDKHCVLGGCVREFELIIYNRWGERVFVSRDQANCWDGNFRGQKVQSGVYVYKIKATLVDGTTISDSGNINVVR